MQEYDETIRSAGWWDASERTAFDITGNDRVRLLQGFCTADVQKVSEGSGTEAFILNPKGKTLALVRVAVLNDRLAIDADPGLGPSLIAHLDKYVIVEDVQFDERQSQRSLLFVAGPKAAQLLNLYFQLDADANVESLPNLGMRRIEADGEPIRVQRRNDFAIASFSIDMSPDASKQLLAWLNDHNVVNCSRETVETLRVEQGTPVFGVDFSDDTLPQELQRNEAAISFKKGCYLGQETVARIDALGHVNRLLVGVKLADGVDAQNGSLLFDDSGKQIGTLSSLVDSPRCGGRIGLATVKRGFHNPGSRCVLDGQQPVEVVAMPFVAATECDGN